MLTERRRVLRLLRDRSLASLWLARLAEQAGQWVFLLALLVTAWKSDGGFSLVAWTVAARFLPRLVFVGLLDIGSRRLPRLTAPVLSVAAAIVAAAMGVALLATFDVADVLIVGAAAGMGSLAAVSNQTRPRALQAALGLTRLGAGGMADALVDRAGLLIGTLAAAAILMFATHTVALFVAAGLLVVAALLLFSQIDRGGDAERALPKAHETSDPRAVARRIAIYLVGSFTAGALASVLLVVALRLASTEQPSSMAYAASFVAAAGLGMILGPLPVSRLLLRIPAPLILLATSFVMATVAVVIAVSGSATVALVAMLVFGLAAVTQDTLTAIAVRRLVPGDLYERVARLMLLALTVGQVYGAVGVVSLGATADPLAALVLLAISQVLLVAFAIAMGGRSSLRVGGLSSLPIKSVVHKLSWDTQPPAVASDFAVSDARVRRLAKWISRQANVERLVVILPVSKRVYEIYRPDEESRERLFELGRADPEKQMPYWAKVWPSGVALADVVVERKLEVSDKHVLELGAGLGVTAAAVLEYGGHIVTADYSALPLAHCRLNALVNTGRTPRATCFNWRHDDEVTAATAQAEFRDGFPLIIAGDVLYEGRDAEPLLNVIERLLVADGYLWLAEPVRRTAQRFLDSAATLGWQIDSRQVKADWPDATNGPVNVHFLTRSAQPDRIVADLGGWRI
ncbi:MAG: hypothetical protein H0W07_02990 [Chloroflexi bacterium]|nr:hypothetical protein [Chloroflexota bacterium]